MIYGYARVSGKTQERYGNSLDDQEVLLRGAGCEKIYRDSYTGTKIDRPEFTKLLNVLKRGDTLVITKLDRFARSAADGAKTLEALVARGVDVNILNMGKADNTPMGKLMIHIMFSFAEFERDMIVERTSAGKARAKERDANWREGRKRLEVDESEFEKFREKQKGGEMTVDECCEALGISRATWYRRVGA